MHFSMHKSNDFPFCVCVGVILMSDGKALTFYSRSLSNSFSTACVWCLLIGLQITASLKVPKKGSKGAILDPNMGPEMCPRSVCDLDHFILD